MIRKAQASASAPTSVLSFKQLPPEAEPFKFAPEPLQDPELRRRSYVGLNKGEQQNALRRAVFFNRFAEIRDRSYENQSHRASRLNLLVAAIIRWNTVYLQRAVDHCTAKAEPRL